MNSSMNLPDFRTARRNLDRAQTAYKNAMLTPAIRSAGTSDEWEAAYYSSSTLKSFKTRFDAFNKSAPDRARFAGAAFEAICTAWVAYDVARLAEKARKADKRAVVAAKRDLKSELNLQEGVSLKGVDVGQYKVILAGLEPVRLHVYESRMQQFRVLGERIASDLMKHGMDVVAAYPDTSKYARPGDYELPDFFSLFFELGSYTNAQRQRFATRREQGEEYSRKHDNATQFALAYVQGYAAKLAVKTGEAIAVYNEALTYLKPTHQGVGPAKAVVSASVSTTNLWSDSYATIILDNGNQQMWHTQIIWNRSCLGKVFNQYPTRRVA